MPATQFSVPVTRAVDKSLRLLELTYQLALAHWPIPAGQLQQSVVGYAALNGDSDALARTFERDKVDLRALGVRLETRPAGDELGEPGYLAPRAALFLPAPTADARWGTLQAGAPALQRVLDALPALDPRPAAEAACALLPFAGDLGLRIPRLALPTALRQRTDHLIEWIHALLVAAVREGRETKRPGLPVPVERLAELTGLEPELLWHVAERGADRPPGHVTHVRQRIRIEAPGRDEGVVVLGRIERPWRPRADHLEALAEAALTAGVPVADDLSAALRQLQR